MLLEALEFLERRDVGIAVIQVHHETDRHLLVLEMVEERAAAGPIVERPAEGVLRQTGSMLLRRNLPQLLQTDAELWRIAILVELEALDELLGQRPTRSLGEQRVFGAQFHA